MPPAVPAGGWVAADKLRADQKGLLVAAARSACMRGSGSLRPPASGACPERPPGHRGLPGTRPRGPPQSGAVGLRLGGEEPLSQADPGALAPWAGAVTSAHPRGRWHGSGLARRPPSVPLLGRTTRRVLLTPQPGQAQVGGADPFHLPGPQLPLSLAWTERFLNSIAQGPGGLRAGGAGWPLRPLTKEPLAPGDEKKGGPAWV